MKSSLQLLRPKEWVKNLFLFAPLFFSGELLAVHKLLYASAGFFLFSFAASSMYILNDILDLAFDKLHPVKMRRPLPAGKISVKSAWLIFLTLIIISLAGSFFLHQNFGFVVLSYLLLNFAYSFFLKRFAIIDISCISIGFLLRIVGGGILVSVMLSPWLFIMTFLVSIFLALGKRRDDVLLLQSNGEQMRKSIKGYNLEFINSGMAIMAAVLIVCYINYITSPEVTQRIASPYLFITVFFVVIALLRYLQITLVEQKSGSPTEIVTKDFIILSMIAAWFIHFSISIYQ